MKIVLAFLLVVLIAIPALAQTGGEESPGGSDQPTAGDATPTVEAPAPAPVVRAIPVRLDTPLTVSLDGATAVNLSYKSSGSETISISARSLADEDVLDPYVTVLDASGAEIATNDDHRTSRTDLAPSDSLIASLTLSAAGQYTIEVASLTGNPGDVEVIVAAGSPEAPQSNETINDSVEADATYTYDFKASAGDVLTITVRETDGVFDPQLSILDASGVAIASNDDQVTDPSLGPYDSQVANLEIPATGTYTVQITGYDGGGTFELTINQGGDVTPPTDEPSTPEPDERTVETVEGTVQPNDVYTYSIDMREGDVYTITVKATSDDLDPLISVYLNDDFILDNDDYGSTDNSLASTDARIYNWIVADTGRYEFDISGYSDSAGDFTMTIERSARNAPTGTPEEEVVLAAIGDGETYTYEFTAEAGEYVTISARVLTRDADPYIVLYDEEGTVVIDNDNTGSSNADLGFYDSQIPNYLITASGTYYVEVSDVNGVSATYGLTVSTLR